MDVQHVDQPDPAMTHRPPSPSPPSSEAGPSRIRRTSTAPTSTPATTSESQTARETEYPRRPASPANTLPRVEGSTIRKHDETERDPETSGDGHGDGDGDVDDTGLPPRPSTPYLDLATYPTQNLLRLLASLLQQIASANDQLRPEMQEEGMEEDPSGAGAGAASATGGGEDNNSSTSGTRSRADSRASNQNPHTPSGGLHPSPTTALFNSHPPPSVTPIRKSSLSPTTGRAETLFTASKTSLSHHSSLLSFHARHIPSISIEAYLLRILKYCPTTNEVFLGLLVYFDRMSRLGTPGGLGGMMKGGKGFAIDSYNVHRLVIAGVTVASKFFSDVFYTNSRYAKVGGLPPHELNQLELQFLLLNDFRLVIPADEMQRYGNRLLGYWENREAEGEDDGAAAAAEEQQGTTPRRHSPNANGVGAPTEDQVKAASAMVRNESTPTPTTATATATAEGQGSSTSPTTPNADAAQYRTSNHNGGNGGEERPSVPRQMTQPTRIEGGFQPSTNRRNSFDSPSNGTGPITNAIPTA